MTSLTIKVERINVFRSESDLSNFVEPSFDLSLEFRFFAGRTGFVKSPGSRYVLSHAESVWLFHHKSFIIGRAN